jgi:hypothetical protein
LNGRREKSPAMTGNHGAMQAPVMAEIFEEWELMETMN